MADRRSIIRGLMTVPLVGGATLPIAAASADPFPAYFRERMEVVAKMNGGNCEGEAFDALDCRWIEIDELASTSLPTTLAGAIACIEWVRAEHVQFNMDDETEGHPGPRLVLHLIDSALSVLRHVGGGRDV